VKKLIEIGESEKEVVMKRSEVEGRECCQTCGKDKVIQNLSRCKGCESVWYCDKVNFGERQR
jgi:hypothetical protein